MDGVVKTVKFSPGEMKKNPYSKINKNTDHKKSFLMLIVFIFYLFILIK